jgi:hypothetical protein
VAYHSKGRCVLVASAFPLAGQNPPSCFWVRGKLFWLTKGQRVSYAQKKNKTCRFSNMTTVLPATDGAGLPTEPFSESPELFFDPLVRPKRSKWQNHCIIPVGREAQRVICPAKALTGYLPD